MKVDSHVCVKFMKLKLLSNVLRHFVIKSKGKDDQMVAHVNKIIESFIQCEFKDVLLG